LFFLKKKKLFVGYLAPPTEKNQNIAYILINQNFFKDGNFSYTLLVVKREFK